MHFTYLIADSNKIVYAKTDNVAAAMFVRRAVLDIRCFTIPKSRESQLTQVGKVPIQFKNVADSPGELVEVAAFAEFAYNVQRIASLLYGYNYLEATLLNFQRRHELTESIDGTLSLYLADPLKYIQAYSEGSGLTLVEAAKQVTFDFEAVVQVQMKALEYKTRHTATLKNVKTDADLKQWVATVYKAVIEIGMI